MAASQSCRSGCPSCATKRWVLRTVGSAGNDDAVGVIEDRPGVGAEEGKATTPSKVNAETMDNIAKA